jgi:TRAP-type C4-dicarboxylate transport system substrate-binding protein
VALLLANRAGVAAPLRLAHQFREASSAGRVASELAEGAARSGLDIKVFPNGRFGDAPANLRQIATEELDLTIGGSLAIGYLAPEYRSLLIPFLVDRPEDMLAIMTGPIGRDMTASWPERYNIVVLGWFYSSPRVIAAVRPVPGPDALKGLKLRVGGEDAWIGFFERAGAQVAVRLPLEIEAAVRTGVIEAADLPAEALLNNAYARAFRTVAWTAHHYETMFIAASASRLAGLPEAQRRALERQAGEIAAGMTRRDIEADAGYRARLEGNGLVVEAFDPTSLRPDIDRIAEGLSGARGPALIARVRAQLGR